MNESLIADAIGLVGVAMIVLAYFLVASERVNGRDARYHLLNLCGAVLILCSLLVHWNLPSFVIECVWIAISLYGLWRGRRAKRNG